MTVTFTRQTEEVRRRLFTASYKILLQVMDTDFEASVSLSQSINRITVAEQEFSIEDISRPLGKSTFQLRNSNTAKAAGKIEINGWGANPFWEDAPSPPNAKIIIDEQEYNFRNITSWQGLSVFSKKREKQFNFKLYKVYGNESVDYQINLNIPSLHSPAYYATCSLEGVAEINTGNQLLIPVGLLLVQLSFQNEGKDDKVYGS